MPDPEASPLVFPCDFPLKVIGLRTDDFAQTMVGIVLRHAPDFGPETAKMRVSAGGRYLSLTCVIRARSREQLNALYRELTAHPAVKVVL